ncbi:MAG: hypothetical protein FJ318_09925 [SAR202 cluster bacterium]|nr:hypothetical protein [SAR202 cluster bacterium]
MLSGLVIGLVCVAAIAASVAMLVAASVQAYWALGGTGGLAAAWGGAHEELPAPLRAGSAIACSLLIGGAAVVLGAAGYWEDPDGLAWAAWALAALLGAGGASSLALGGTWERRLNAPAAIVVAVLCAIVASAGRA